MKENEYPALFKVADAASNRTQKYHLWTVIGYLSCLIVGSIFAFYGIDNSNLATVAAFIFVISLFLTLFILNKNFENTWYNCRALTESIKTSTWKYMMRAEPYTNSDDVRIVNSEFRNLLKSLLKQNSNLSHEFVNKDSEGDQITVEMRQVRSLSLDERKKFYIEHRIDDQRRWYTKKSVTNKKHRKLWFGLLISLNALALIFVLLRIDSPSFQYWPVEILIVLSGACLTWIQVKKFQELSSAYSLTAQEIGTIRGEIERVDGEEDFSSFVNDSENAFSREHTQWIAKRLR